MYFQFKHYIIGEMCNKKISFIFNSRNKTKFIGYRYLYRLCSHRLFVNHNGVLHICKSTLTNAGLIKQLYPV